LWCEFFFSFTTLTQHLLTTLNKGFSTIELNVINYLWLKISVIFFI